MPGGPQSGAAARTVEELLSRSSGTSPGQGGGDKYSQVRPKQKTEIVYEPTQKESLEDVEGQ